MDWKLVGAMLALYAYQCRRTFPTCSEGIIAFEDILKPKPKPQAPENLDPQTLASTIFARRPEVKRPWAQNPTGQ